MMRQRGLTLVEVIVSLTLIAALVVLVFNLFPGSLLSTARSEQTIQADLMAQSALERKAAEAREDAARARADAIKAQRRAERAEGKAEKADTRAGKARQKAEQKKSSGNH